MYMMYTTETLKNDFSELKKVNESVLVPLVNTAFAEWISNIPNNKLITDFIKEYPVKTPTVYSESYQCVANGKIVKIYSSGSNINIIDKEPWFNINKIHFDGNASNEVFENFRQNIKEQGLENLLKKTASKLMVGKIYQLDMGMRDFYFACFK